MLRGSVKSWDLLFQLPKRKSEKATECQQRLLELIWLASPQTGRQAFEILLQLSMKQINHKYYTLAHYILTFHEDEVFLALSLPNHLISCIQRLMHFIPLCHRAHWCPRTIKTTSMSHTIALGDKWYTVVYFDSISHTPSCCPKEYKMYFRK